MALVVQNGKSLTVKIATVDYSVQCSSARLIPNKTVSQFQTLTGTAAKAMGVTTFQLEVTAYQDWITGAGTSMFEAMLAAEVAGTPVAFELATVGGKFSGNIIPVYPGAGGAADAALEHTFTFEVDGSVTWTNTP